MNKILLIPVIAMAISFGVKVEETAAKEKNIKQERVELPRGVKFEKGRFVISKDSKLKIERTQDSVIYLIDTNLAAKKKEKKKYKFNCHCVTGYGETTEGTCALTTRRGPFGNDTVSCDGDDCCELEVTLENLKGAPNTRSIGSFKSCGDEGNDFSVSYAESY